MDSSSTKEKNYWIKEGLQVRLKTVPELRMVVDHIQFKTKVHPVPEQGTGTIRESKVNIVGVQCHWMTKDYHYQKGVFHTTELEAWT